MAGGSKKTAAGKSKEAKAEREEAPASGGSKSRSRNAKDKNAWPTWLWVVIVIGLVAVLGRFLAGNDEAASSTKVGAKASAKASAKVEKKTEPKAKKKASGTARFLELAMRLQEMTDIATALVDGGILDSAAAKEIDVELKDIEQELNEADGTIARDLLSMVSVVRGTLYQKGNNLTDEEVEGLEDSAYTYANPRYWDEYYKKTTGDEKYDWYGTWDTPIVETTFQARGTGDAITAKSLGDFLRAYLASEDKILMMGCGNSDMSEKMYVAGFEHIVNIDISETLLENLRQRLAASMPNMRWQHMSAAEMSFAEGEFAVTVDKGTLDAIEQNKPLLSGAMREAHRTLRPGGVFLSVTFNSAPLRVEQQLREAADWEVCHTHTFERPKSSGQDRPYYVHACLKRES